jgi:hypothetical protein
MKGDGVELLARVLPPAIYVLTAIAVVLGIVSIVQACS